MIHVYHYCIDATPTDSVAPQSGIVRLPGPVCDEEDYARLLELLRIRHNIQAHRSIYVVSLNLVGVENG